MPENVNWSAVWQSVTDTWLPLFWRDCVNCSCGHCHSHYQKTKKIIKFGRAIPQRINGAGK